MFDPPYFQKLIISPTWKFDAIDASIAIHYSRITNSVPRDQKLDNSIFDSSNTQDGLHAPCKVDGQRREWHADKPLIRGPIITAKFDIRIARG